MNRSRIGRLTPFPDLVLLDIHMYLMDGIEVLAALKERIEFQHLPIVVLSSIEEPKTIQEALKLGANDYLIKPITMEERIEMVRRLDLRWLKAQRQGPSTVVGHRNFNPWSIQSLGQDVLPQPPRKKRT
jgi:CheY-like chemotaxis protein